MTSALRNSGKGTFIMDVGEKSFRDAVDAKIVETCPSDLSSASIREIVSLVGSVEAGTGVEFIRMEMGIPSLPAPTEGVEAEKGAIDAGVASKYPPIDGIPELKTAAAEFAKLFLDVEIPSSNCVPTTGAMQATFAIFMTACRADSPKKCVLLIDPGFPVQKQQLETLGVEYVSVDIYAHRGPEKLKAVLTPIFERGDISTVVYSTPNNPAWMCLSDEELEVIGSLAGEHGAVVVEDLAYFAMDFRCDYSKPGVPPYPPTVAKWTDSYILVFSASKMFSYAGQRIGFMAVSPALFKRRFPGLKRWFSSDEFGHALVYGALYALSSGTSHSAQHALAAMLAAANGGQLDFVAPLREYARRAAAMKKAFLDAGFELVYSMDAGEPLADGFYFTVSYPGMSGDELLRELLRHGISAISLAITGSTRRDGIRACVSLVEMVRVKELRRRLGLFRESVGKHCEKY